MIVELAISVQSGLLLRVRSTYRDGYNQSVAVEKSGKKRKKCFHI